MTEISPVGRWIVGGTMISAGTAALVLAPFSLSVALLYIALGALGGLVFVLKEDLLSMASLVGMFIGQVIITNRVEAAQPQMPTLTLEPLCLTFGAMAASNLIGTYIFERYEKRRS